MSSATHIKGGMLYDPANGVEGEVRDVMIEDGAVVQAFSENAKPRVIDATNQIVMPGGVEMHSHICSLTVNTARKVQSTSGYETVVPDAPTTGTLYSQLGYTTAVEPAVPPGSAAYAHLQMQDIDNLDTAMLILMGNHEGIVDRLANNDRTGAIALIKLLLDQSGGFGIKAVNPAAVAAWRRNASRHFTETIDDTVDGTNVSPRTMLELFTEAQEELHLSHPTHIHGPRLGDPGNVDITLDMLRALNGRRYHLAHLQYYCYGKTKHGDFKADVDKILNYLSEQERATADLGMVAFGPAFTATADLPLEHALYRHVGKISTPAVFYESSNEDCFGLMPLKHTRQSASHSIQWATGLELALKWDNPWQYALTIDHPNGGSFLNYPHLIALLMNKPLRDEQLQTAHKQATTRTDLANVSRELTLNDIAIITRAAPAKALGMKAKGHLGIGADGDVTIYDNKPADPEAMFASPAYVIKAGDVLVESGELVQTAKGRTHQWREHALGEV